MATSDAPFTASTGSAPFRPSRLAFFQLSPYLRTPTTTSWPLSARLSACARPWLPYPRMAIRAFFSAFLSTSLPEYSFVIVDSICKTLIRKTPHRLRAGAGFFGDLPSSSVFASGRRPAPCVHKGQGQRKRYEHEDVRRECRAVESRVVDDLGLHTMRAIAP